MKFVRFKMINFHGNEFEHMLDERSADAMIERLICLGYPVKIVESKEAETPIISV